MVLSSPKPEVCELASVGVVLDLAWFEASGFNGWGVEAKGG